MWHFRNFGGKNTISELFVPVVIEISPVVIDTGLIMAITCFNMDIAIEGFYHFKVVNWVGITINWEQSANEKDD